MEKFQNIDDTNPFSALAENDSPVQRYFLQNFRLTFLPRNLVFNSTSDSSERTKEKKKRKKDTKGKNLPWRIRVSIPVPLAC